MGRTAIAKHNRKRNIYYGWTLLIRFILLSGRNSTIWQDDTTLWLFFRWNLDRTRRPSSPLRLQVVKAFLAGQHGVFYLLVSVCSITAVFLSGLVWEQAALMGKAHLWRSARSAPSLRGLVGAGGGRWGPASACETHQGRHLLPCTCVCVCVCDGKTANTTSLLFLLLLLQRLF